MLPARRTPDGALYVSTIAPQPTDIFKHGIAMTSDGVMRVVDAPPDVVHNLFIAGFGLLEPGALAVSFGGAIARYNQGIPMTADGRVVCQLNQPVSPGDQYIAGVRVGPLGGVYVVDTAPPLNDPWSSGFSSGFGNGP
jgi:hypothetical protein